MQKRGTDNVLYNDNNNQIKQFSEVQNDHWLHFGLGNQRETRDIMCGWDSFDNTKIDAYNKTLNQLDLSGANLRTFLLSLS